MISNIFSQEVFFEKKQTGYNLSYFYSNAGKSLNRTGNSISHSVAGSYVFKGKIFLHGRIINSKNEVNFEYPETIDGSGYGFGVGFITSTKDNLFSLLISVDYSSAKYNSKYESEINIGGVTANISIFKIIKITQHLKFVPEIFTGYGIADISSESDSRRGNVFGYGFGINIGYLKEKYFGPSIGIAISGSGGLAAYSLRGTISIGN